MSFIKKKNKNENKIISDPLESIGVISPPDEETQNIPATCGLENSISVILKETKQRDITLSATTPEKSNLKLTNSPSPSSPLDRSTLTDNASPISRSHPTFDFITSSCLADKSVNDELDKLRTLQSSTTTFSRKKRPLNTSSSTLPNKTPDNVETVMKELKKIEREKKQQEKKEEKKNQAYF